MPLSNKGLKRLTRSKDGGSACLVDHLVILRRDDATHDDQNVGSAHLFEDLNKFWDEASMSGRQRWDAYNMDISVDGLLGNFLRSLWDESVRFVL